MLAGMTSTIFSLPSPSDLAPLEQLVERAGGYAVDSRAPATRRASARSLAQRENGRFGVERVQL
jgi:hypothetical protein